MAIKTLHTLIPLADFKTIISLDDRDDKLAEFCLKTATKTIEQYCQRHFLRKEYFEWNEYNGDLLIPLREYPVSRVLAVYLIGSVKNLHPCRFLTSELAQTRGLAQTPTKALVTAASMPLEPDFYNVIPDCGTDYDLPFSLYLSRAIQRQSGISSIKVVYWAGYSEGLVPADLSSACLELASWNMNRYKGRRIGMTGNVRGGGKDGEHFEKSMPENVKALLEPYRRKTI